MESTDHDRSGLHKAGIVAIVCVALALGVNAVAQSPPGFTCSTGLALSGSNTRTRLQQTLESCAAECRSWVECRSFDFGFNQGGVCYLTAASVRSGTGRTVPNARYMYCERSHTAVAKPQPPARLAAYACQPGTALSGNNDVPSPGHTKESCLAACDADKRCLSIDISATGTCNIAYASASGGIMLVPAPAYEYCEKTDDPPPGGSTPPVPGVAGVPPAPPTAPPAAPPGGQVSLSPDTQVIDCWSNRLDAWSTMTISCVSGWSRTGRGMCENPRALQLMDQWFAAKASGRTRYDCWGRGYPYTSGGAVRVCAGDKPETEGRSRCEYLGAFDWGTVPRLGTLLDYVKRNL